MTEVECTSPDKNWLKEGEVEVDLGNLLRARAPVYSLFGHGPEATSRSVPSSKLKPGWSRAKAPTSL